MSFACFAYKIKISRIFLPNDLHIYKKCSIFAAENKLGVLYTKPKGDKTMARPIAETPVLSGDDALRFEEAINNVQPLSHERRAAMDAQYQSFTSRVTINI